MDTDPKVARRDFLAASGMLTGLLAAGAPLALLAPSRAWALELKALTSAQGAAMLMLARTIAPHDTLEDAAYALVVGAVDADAAASADAAAMIRDGLAGLGEGFASAAEPARVAAVRRIETTPFFAAMRAKTLAVLYSSPLAAAHFGYEGEAFSKGGYLARGFNDLKWLPEVPLADSGPLY